MLVTEHQELKLREGKNFFKRGKAILSDAGFNLRKWVINFQIKETPDHKILLGIEWDTKNDEFVFQFLSFVTLAQPAKKRKHLKVYCFIF